MNVITKELTASSIKVDVSATKKEIEDIKAKVLLTLAKDVKIAGFREGKAPANLVEKYVDQNLLNTQFLNEAVADLYEKAVKQKQLRVVSQPKITITKFVPYETLDFSAETDYIGSIVIPDYKKVNVSVAKNTVSEKDIKDVLNNLSQRQANKLSVERAAKDKDEVNLDFYGTDPKTKQPIGGADGKSYDLVIGSKTFIPGFEEEIIGLKTGDKKTFNITFPKDYGVAELKNKVVKFDVVINDVKELAKSKIDDTLAKSVGPFKNLSELKADIKKQLKVEKDREYSQKLDNEILNSLSLKTKVVIPTSLIEQEIDRLEEDEKRSIAYRGQTWQEHLAQENVNETEHRDRQRPIAEARIKSGLILGEISEKENIKVSDMELETRVNHLKSQYSDPNMLAELENPNNLSDLRSRLMIEKTLDKLKDYNKQN